MSTELAVREQEATPGYYEREGLSYSAMKDLAVSPLRFWHLHVNPNRPERTETPEMKLGTALHCAVLRPGDFEREYVRSLNPEEIDGVLVTMEDLRGWLKANGRTPKGTRKAEVIEQVMAADPSAPVLDVLQARFEEQHAGKITLHIDEWERVTGCAEALLREPKVRELLADGQAEFPMFATDPETGVALKAKADWVTPLYTVDLKTFSQKRAKSIDETITDAIWYEGYHIQAWWYTMMRSLLEGDRKMSGPQTARPAFVLAFVESEQPHEVRVRVLRSVTSGQANLYWERARIHCREMIRLYAEYSDRFGKAPWRDPRGLDPLVDEELKQLVFG